jgi:sulfur relay protein TusB/DsrH
VIFRGGFKMALYLLDKPYGENGLELAVIDNDSKIVLIQDGVYLDISKFGQNKEIYAVDTDVKKRGMASKLSGKVKFIDYSKLVDLIVENKVINFT